ncbi:unnamed protein product [marine sediment metagenome]|uniref:Uncharacterized protein n=1 Tax=marine sediment metagenome TaxID=412755 RepID=X0V3W8_9ZZZZ
MAELNTKLIMKTVLPRVLKATVWGTFTFVMVYYLPLMLIPKDIPQNIIPFDYTAQLLDFAMISIFFAVVGQLFSGTVIGCGFGIARAIVIIAYFFVVSDGGVFSVTLPISEVTVNLTLDITIILLMIVSVNLLSIAKNLLAAITILTEKSTRIDFT